jgi:D-alanyl-D-alanine carboxypeptidase
VFFEQSRARAAGHIAAVLALVLSTFLAAPELARAQNRYAAMVIDANTGQVLHNQFGDEARHPASLTKMMTLYMAFELIEAGRLSYGARIKVSQEAASVAPSKLDLEPGEQILVSDAIKALVTKSANDMAVALAEYIGGSEANFVRLMNAKARKIGMANTTFRNASGLPDPEQVTTARDMLTLALRLQDDFPQHYQVFATRAFNYNGGTYRNHNTMLNSYRGMDGIKTGYTRASGFNLVASVRRDGRHLVAAVFGGASSAARNAQMRVLLDRSWARASTQKTRKPVLIASAAPAVRRAAAASTARPEPPPPRADARPAPQPPPAEPAPPARAPEPAVAPGVPPLPPPPESRTDVEPSPPVNVEIARVRQVMVAPRPRAAPVPVSEPAPRTEEAPRDAALRGTIGPEEARAPAPPPQPPAPFPAPVSLGAAPEPEPPAPLAFVAPVPMLGARPSTLQAQAANLESGRPAVLPAPPPRPAAPMAQLAAPPAQVERAPPPPAAPAVRAAAGAFQIQVGAYASPAEAERQLSVVGQRASGLLASRTPLTLPTTRGDRPMYRARFAGFDSAGATKACAELRRLAVDCLVMKAE